MRHLKRNNKLGRKSEHRNALIANLACSLIKHSRVTTTLAKAKALRPVAEKLVTLGKLGNIATAGTGVDAIPAIVSKESAAKNVHYRRLASAKLRQQARSFFRGSKTNPGKTVREQWKSNEDVVHILFDRIAPVFAERVGGYTRIVRLGSRRGDVASMAIIEWVSSVPAV